jgi:formate hydrogenlyase subunit 3/multisubunit Na+/H+ antiporter MnhD subunit
LDQSAFVFGQEVAFGQPVVIVGRHLALDPAGQMWLAFAFGMATVFYLLAWRVSQGRSFFPFSLIILSLYSLVVLLHNFPLAVVTFAISTALAVFIVQAGIGTSIRGAQRYLVVALLAVPFLLTAAWMADQSVPSTAGAGVQQSVLLPAALGFAFLLAVFPFGTWMPAVAAAAPPIVAAFIFTVGQAMALFLAVFFIQSSPLSLGDPAVTEIFLLAGMIMAASGGIMAAAQRDFGRLLGYAALSSLGILLLAFPGGGSQGLELAMLQAISRAMSITLMAASLAILRHRTTTDAFDKLGGVARRLPIATLGLVLGGLALAGFPFTAGFPTHWAIGRATWNWVWPISTLAQDITPGAGTVELRQWMWILALIAIVASSLGIIIGIVRGLSAMLGSEPREQIAKQPIIASLMIAALVVFSIALALYPQLFFEPVHRAAEALSLF